MGRATLIEAAHLAGGLGLTAAIFQAASWAYPQGQGTIWYVGLATMAAVVVMSVPELLKARAVDQGAGRDERFG